VKENALRRESAILDQVDVVCFTQGILDASEHLIGCVAMGNYS